MITIVQSPSGAVSKESIGLGNVDNTPDSEKPVSTAQQAALDAKQDAAANLGAFAAIVGVADKGVYFTAPGTIELFDLSAAGRGFLALTTANAQRAALGLGSMALQPAEMVDITGGTIQGITPLAVADGGTGGNDAASGREGLELGDSATRDVGTTVGTVAAGDDARLSDAREPTAHTHPVGELSDATEAGKGVLTSPISPVRELVQGTSWGELRKGGIWVWRGGAEELEDIITSNSVAPITIVNKGSGLLVLWNDDAVYSVDVPAGFQVTFEVDNDKEPFNVETVGIGYTPISQATAEAGTNNSGWISILRVVQYLSGSVAKTIAGAVNLTGNLTLGSSSGNAHTINGGITAAHATSVGASSVANVGTLDPRYAPHNLTAFSPGTLPLQNSVAVYGTYNMAAAVRSVTSLTRSGATATVVSAGHGFTTGMRISIWGASPAGFNGEYIITVIDPDSFSYTLDSDPGADATGTITAVNNWVQLFTSTANLGNVIQGDVAVAATAAGSGDHVRFMVSGGNTASSSGVPTVIERSGYGWIDIIRCSRSVNNGLCVEVRLNDATRSYSLTATYRPLSGAAPGAAFVGGSPGPIGSGATLNCRPARLPMSKVITLDPPSIASGAVGNVLSANDVTNRQILSGGLRKWVSVVVHPITPLPTGLVLISAQPDGTAGQVRLYFLNTSGSAIDAGATEFLLRHEVFTNNQ